MSLSKKKNNKKQTKTEKATIRQNNVQERKNPSSKGKYILKAEDQSVKIT